MLIQTLENLNTMFYNYFNNNAIFASNFFIFFIILWCMDLNALSMSESLAISLWLEWKILQSFFFLYSKTNVVWSFFNSLNNSVNFFMLIGFVLISCNSESKKIQNLYITAMYTITRRIWLHHLSIFFYFMLLERYKAIQQLF